MKKTGLFILLICGFISCKNNCSKIESIEKTEVLKINDKLPSFYPFGSNKLSFLDLKKEQTIIFFKKEIDDIHIGYNEEINNTTIWREIKEKQIDFIVVSDLKIAKNYGVQITNNKIKDNYLFIADKNKNIQKIYKNVCVNNITKIITKTYNTK